MRQIIGVDPGPDCSGLVVIDERLTVQRRFNQVSTQVIEGFDMPLMAHVTLVIEDLSPRGGGSVGQMFARWKRTIQTAKTIGTIKQICAYKEWDFIEINPSTWRTIICGAPNATPAQIKACIRELYETRGLADGGGTHSAIGISNKRGPLYGLRGHAWDALGVALAHLDMEGIL